MSKVVSKFNKNAMEEIRVSLSEFKGHRLIDIRSFFGRKEDDRNPTKKGISISVALYPDLKKAIEELEEVLLADGLLQEEDLEFS